VTEQPQRTDTAGRVDTAIREHLRAAGQLGDGEVVTAEVVVAKVRRMGPDGPVGCGRRVYLCPLPVDSDEASSMLSCVSDELRTGGAWPA
jgi:hypothetical protein